MLTNKKTKIPIFFAILASLLAFNFACINSALAVPISEEETEMEAKIKDLEDKISKYREGIIANQNKAKSLQTEINILDSEANKAELEIQRIDLIIRKLDIKIREKESSIKEIEQQVDLEKTSLAETIREISKYDDVSVLEIILKRGQLSDFLSEMNSLENFQNQIQGVLNKIYNLKAETEIERTSLSDEKGEQMALQDIQETQRLSLEKAKKDKKTLLAQTKGQEALFAQLEKKTKLDIEAIKNKLYSLKGMIAGGALRFEDAYKFAKFASIYTGIRPAFLLAILSRESGLGKNVGTGSWRIDMKPSQRTYYLQICEKLGLDPDGQNVSKKQWYGWGGAMGPAQMMPATWMGYEARITEITGNNPPSPWNVKDSFVAAALYLVNKGADQKTYDAEWKAAMMYLAGSNWSNRSLSFYGDQVMDLAEQLQEQVNILEKG